MISPSLDVLKELQAIRAKFASGTPSDISSDRKDCQTPANVRTICPSRMGKAQQNTANAVTAVALKKIVKK